MYSKKMSATAHSMKAAPKQGITVLFK
jgi:hypothetical protein